MATWPKGGDKKYKSAYLEYAREREKGKKFWLKYSAEILEKKNVTRSELEAAAIGARPFDAELAEKLMKRKVKTKRANLNFRPREYGASLSWLIDKKKEVRAMVS